MDSRIFFSNDETDASSFILLLTYPMRSPFGLRCSLVQKAVNKVGQHGTIVSILASGPSCPGLIPSTSEEKLPMLQRFINGAAWRKVDSCLNMLIKLI